MLTITIPEGELWDEKKEEFVFVKSQTIKLEHSLVSISKWESKWNIPFFSSKQKTYDQLIDYIECMTITQNVNPHTYLMLTKQNFEDINRYIEAPMTATTFINDRQTGHGEVITSELIYYWMIVSNIPFECQKWHIKRLLTLIKICGIKNQPPKKMSRTALLQRNASLNAARRKALHSKG